MSDPVDLDVLAALEAKATPGEWTVRGYRDHYHDQDDDPESLVMLPTGENVSFMPGHPNPDAELIAAMRTALPTMIAELRGLRGLRGAVLAHVVAMGPCDNIIIDEPDAPYCGVDGCLYCAMAEALQRCVEREG